MLASGKKCSAMPCSSGRAPSDNKWAGVVLHRKLSRAQVVTSTPNATSGSNNNSKSTIPLSGSSLGLIQKTRPVDRLRYQAKLVFDYLDTDRDGSLTSAQVGGYVEYCNDRFGSGRTALDDLYTPLLVEGAPLGFEDFVDLVRQQVDVLSKNNTFVESQLRGAELGRLMYKCAITAPQLSRALVIFKLMDFNNDGYLRVDELAQVQGIEKKIFDDVLEDADTNSDGFLTYEDFLTSYSKERPVLLSIAVMAAHTASFYVLLNSPLDTIFKVAIALVLVLRPAIITNPVIRLWQIIVALVNRLRATQEVMALGGDPA